uniref:Uncharacterized protein n=1 Tax=Anguilla anguilla TaxID=7936 RepID=A0A0E9RIT2_ANGAN
MPTDSQADEGLETRSNACCFPPSVCIISPHPQAQSARLQIRSIWRRLRRIKGSPALFS